MIPCIEKTHYLQMLYQVAETLSNHQMVPQIHKALSHLPHRPKGVLCFGTSPGGQWHLLFLYLMAGALICA